MDQPRKGRTALITGASGALGSAVVREFVQTDLRLVLTSRSMDQLKALVDEVEIPEWRVLCVAADITQQDAIDNLMAAIGGRFGRIEVLLNSVGGWSGGNTVAETPVEDWQRLLDLNLHSAFLLSRAVLPGMLESGWGRIVHVSSKTAVQPRAKQAGYSVAKMGLITLTEAIAAETKGTGVTANVILPSIIDTPANRRFMSKADPGKWVPPEEIAATMRFLCSDEAASINGVRIPIYGAV
jgi:NAD(P)-dependent dehydrogenase (short-subunit alcohol dehydrogenase family)